MYFPKNSGMLLIEVKKYSGDDPVNELYHDVPFDGFIELVSNTDKNSLKEVLTMINGRHPDIVDLILDYLYDKALA